MTTDNVASATKLATARTINGVSFDGSANITVPRIVPTDITGVTIDLDTLNMSTLTPSAAYGAVEYYINRTDGGAANITNIPVTGKPFSLQVKSIRWASATDYITEQRFLSSSTKLEYRRWCTGGTWTSWEQLKYTDTTYSNMTGASSSAAGTAGLVPAPTAGKQTSFLRGDGTWVVPTNTTYGVATTSANGLMSAADKTKLDSISSSLSSSGDVGKGLIYNITNGLVTLLLSVFKGTAFTLAGLLQVKIDTSNGTVSSVAAKGISLDSNLTYLFYDIKSSSGQIRLYVGTSNTYSGGTIYLQPMNTTLSFVDSTGAYTSGNLVSVSIS